MENDLGLHIVWEIALPDSFVPLKPEEYRQKTISLISDCGLSYEDHGWKDFGNNAFSIGCVLSESHLNLHTFYEEGRVTADVYVCNYMTNNRSKAERLFMAITNMFGGVARKVHRIDR